MADEQTATQQLLSRWHGGDEESLAELLARHLPWIEAQVSKRLGTALRKKAETQDFVQDALVQALRYSPRFTIQSGDMFRRLLLAIIQNVLRDRSDWFNARRREMHRERPLARDTILRLDPPVQEVESPSKRIELEEERALVRLALELMPPEEQRLILRREWDGWEFSRIGQELSITGDAARMRFHRALLQLQARVEQLSNGLLDRILSEQDGDGHE
ncbi:MAG: RNA polymerase sigma factor [Planctomycetota bacterium]